MLLSKNDKTLAELKEKVRLVEKSGQKNTVHHQNLDNYLKSITPTKSVNKEIKGVNNVE